MPQKLTALAVDRVDLVDAGANQYADIVIFKAAPAQEPVTVNPGASPEAAITHKGDATMTMEQVEKRLGELEAENGTLRKSLEAAEAARKTAEEKLAKSEPLTEIEKRLSAFPEEIRKQMEPVVARQVELEKRLADSEAREQVAEFAKRATESYPNIPGENLGAVLHAVSKLDKTVGERLDTVLKAANEAFGQLTKELGSARASLRTGSAVEKIQKRADEIRKADPNVTQADAFVRASNEDPQLLAEYRREQYT